MLLYSLNSFRNYYNFMETKKTIQGQFLNMGQKLLLRYKDLHHGQCSLHYYSSCCHPYPDQQTVILITSFTSSVHRSCLSGDLC